MKDRDPLTVRDDTQGHSFHGAADSERDETDTEGHNARVFGNAEEDEIDDTEGHNFKI
jgi:hypothetical protein